MITGPACGRLPISSALISFGPAMRRSLSRFPLLYAGVAVQFLSGLHTRHTMIPIRTSLFVLLTLLTACAPVPQRAGIPTTWQASPNFNERKPNFVVIHHTSDDTVDQALRTLADSARRVSAHYLIGRDGTIIQLVDERARAWHAGESKWGANTDLNSASLGIELDNNGREPFSDAQISALLRKMVLVHCCRVRSPAMDENHFPTPRFQPCFVCWPTSK